MKERPILFSTEMVKAILDGRKTMTRRIIKRQPSEEVGEFLRGCWPCRRKQYEYMGDPEQGHEVSLKPYAFIGDCLWLRETWKPTRNMTALQPKRTYIRYKAGDSRIEIQHDFVCGGQDSERWRSGRFLKKIYSRITLEITDVRVERLQDITEEDALKEGFIVSIPYTAAEKFALLWDNLYKKKPEYWGANPWVWVISFKRNTP